jgi:hypothetical protein
VILAIRFTRPWLEITCGALAVLGFVAGWRVIRAHSKVEPEGLATGKVNDLGGEVAGYLATYLLPFVTVADPTWRDLVGYFLFLSVTGVIYVRSSLVQLNPTLYLLGWRVASVEFVDEKWSGFVISRRRLRDGEPDRAVRLTDRLYIDYSRRDRHA